MALNCGEVTAAEEEAVHCVLWGLGLTHGGVVETGFPRGICVKEREEGVEVRLVGAIGGESLV